MLHIELRRWADCLVIAPLSANTLAKCAQGLCDNLLTCVVSAFHSSILPYMLWARTLQSERISRNSLIM